MKTTKEMIAVMEAFDKEKKPVQVRDKSTPYSDWHDTVDPSWDWYRHDYRIHPKHNIAPGHNPDKLTVEQVGEGYRLLEPDELVFGEVTSQIHTWYKNSGDWLKYNHGNPKCSTYRTKLSREALHAVRFPKPPITRRVPLGPADFPPGTLLRCSVEYPKIPWIQYAINIYGLVVWWPDHTVKNWTYNDLTVLYTERSLDGGRTWLPCYKEVTE